MILKYNDYIGINESIKFDTIFSKRMQKIMDNFASFMSYYAVYDKLYENGYMYIDVQESEEDNWVSYLPSDKLNIVESNYLDPWNNRYRQPTKIGKLLKRVTGAEDKLIEDVTNLFKIEAQKLKGGFHFELVNGEEIRKWYLNTNYDSQYGSLGSSCMRHEHSQRRFDIYAKNPSVCNLLILKRNEGADKISGRALVWKTDKGTYMDRVYTIKDDTMYILFREYAEKNNWLLYSNRSNLKLIVKLEYKPSESRFNNPYMDTFEYYYPRLGVLSNRHLGSFKDFIVFKRTPGSYVNFRDY
jgi:hypothetical protein